MKSKVMALLLALCLLLAGCAAKRPAETPADPTAAPTPTPSPTPGVEEDEENADLDRNDEADYYFDFGQDDMIRLNYDVSWPADEMEGWQEQPCSRVGALLMLCKGESTITVLMEEAAEYGDLDAYMEYTRQVFRYTCADTAPPQESTEGQERVLTGALEDGALIQWRCRTVNGLFVTCELVSRGEETELAQFTDTFCPNITFTYTEIEKLTGDHGEE